MRASASFQEEARSRAEGQYGFALTPEAENKLLRFTELLWKWNAVYNLTAIREPDKMLTHHLRDSLAITRFIAESASILDVGAGAGLPGIPIAVARPDCQVTLIDANSKKTAFCEQARIELQLENLKVVNGRVENYAPVERFDYVVSRAFGSLAQLAVLAGGHLLPGGAILAMKGSRGPAEIPALGSRWDAAVHEIEVPGIDAERCIVVLTRRINQETK